MRILFIILGILTAIVFAAITAAEITWGKGPVSILIHYEGRHDCFVKETEVPFQGEMVGMAGMNCPMREKHPALYMTVLPHKSGMVDGNIYQCDVYKQWVLLNYQLQIFYSFEYCLYIDRRKDV